jgi:hypothetical protein
MDEDRSLEYQDVNTAELMKEEAFVSSYPFSEIISRMRNQFIDYINNKDMMNYVSLFFNSVYISFTTVDVNAADEDFPEQYAEEKRNALMLLQEEFIEEIRQMFSDYIGIGIPDVENFDADKLVAVLNNLYMYFILQAKDNFKVAISDYLNKTLKTSGDKYFTDLQATIESSFLTYITVIDPSVFLQVTSGAREVYPYFMENVFTGNFLRKYTPSLYKNDDFKAEIINYTTVVKLIESKGKMDTE